ncbi:hypothetical protein AAFF_G00419080 [Aldrovandia affinis]|uniref:Uncharacterized protein n=1 Tax=Aldrovandia affinis TaxID=143900 RepID=A0AAD7WIX8_9TELE|nr:hypothetical protein AAFF_G00419080 [Aldrovandia affinis]
MFKSLHDSSASKVQDASPEEMEMHEIPEEDVFMDCLSYPELDDQEDDQEDCDTFTGGEDFSDEEVEEDDNDKEVVDSIKLAEVLAGIAPASLRRDAATLALARKAQKYDWHILHKATTTPAPPCRLKSRHPYNKAAQEMLQSIPEDLSRDAWLAASWKQTWETAGPSCILRYIRDPGDGLKLVFQQTNQTL